MTEVDCYPWAMPTPGQRQDFDRADPDEQRTRLRQALIEGENSGVAKPLDVEKIRANAKQSHGL